MERYTDRKGVNPTMHRIVLVIAAAAALLALAIDTVSAKAIPVPLDQKVAESDFVGIVRILDIEPLLQPTEREARRPYRQLARVEILRSLKGPQAGSVVDLEFDNGLACPNATYVTATEYLVFWRAIDSQRYATHNFYYGRFPIDDGRVTGWGDNWKNPPEVPTVIAEIEALLEP
jgi:hypothetical protein